jgi:hypothetical protein
MNHTRTIGKDERIHDMYHYASQTHSHDIAIIFTDHLKDHTSCVSEQRMHLDYSSAYGAVPEYPDAGVSSFATREDQHNVNEKRLSRAHCAAGACALDP